MKNNLTKALFTFPFRLIIFYSLISLLFGMGIYLFFRSSELLFFDWLNRFGLRESLESIRSKTVIWHTFLPDWLVFSLPNGLWAFSYSSLIFFLWGDSAFRIKYFWMGTTPFIVFGFELLQLTGTIPGTFCKQDLIFLAVGMGSGIVTGTIITKNRNHEKKIT